MKKYLYIAASLFFCISCCHLQYQVCDGLDTIQKIRFENFSQAELDSVYLITYALHTNFHDTVQAASLLTTPVSTPTIFAFETDAILTKDYDYKISGRNFEYFVNDFILIERECKQCGQKKYKYSQLQQVSVNNIAQSNFFPPPTIVIKK